MNGDVLERAIHFAVDAHRGMTRKLGDAPYILHPLEALVVAGTLTSDREVLAAMVLHDVVEDAGVEPSELKERFGERVMELVATETEDKMRDRPASETWRLRKEQSLAKLSASRDPAVQIIWLGDKLSNIRSLHAAWLRDGHAIWKSFYQTSAAQQAWYYRSVAAALPDLRDTAAWQEYVDLVEEVFAGVKEEKGC